jgi:uncharacterized protein YbjT (DUF2867 family)
MTGSILVYGATGYTGKLVAQVSRAKGSNVILAGRKRTWRTAGLDVSKWAGNRLAQPRGFRRLLEQPAELARRRRLTIDATGKQPALFRRNAGVTPGRPRLPRLPQ